MEGRRLTYRNLSAGCGWDALFRCFREDREHQDIGTFIDRYCGYLSYTCLDGRLIATMSCFVLLLVRLVDEGEPSKVITASRVDSKPVFFIELKKKMDTLLHRQEDCRRSVPATALALFPTLDGITNTQDSMSLYVLLSGYCLLSAQGFYV